MSANTVWTRPAEVRLAVEICEGASVESLWAVEHVLTPSTSSSRSPFKADGGLDGLNDVVLCDPVVWSAHAAACSTTLRLGTGIVILPQRHPAYVAGGPPRPAACPSRRLTTSPAPAPGCSACRTVPPRPAELGSGRVRRGALRHVCEIVVASTMSA
ncbi:LLM class flavin-dependent oxidoreductase [Ilumatobacter sp.]|uniref:LLM class flavin-dependent oxidoreductase n=1 Tax=Ilumatobacter sp. TaxID=1967498 RepID=UPI003B5281E5